MKYQNFRTELAEGVGEVAGVLFRVAKYAYEKVGAGLLLVRRSEGAVPCISAAVQSKEGSLRLHTLSQGGRSGELKAPLHVC